MKILLVESFYGGSHKLWADQLKKYFGESLTLLTLPDRFWKWRMEASGIELSRRYLEMNVTFDILLISDLINVPQFLCLSHVDRQKTKVFLYMHENQICYPWKADKSVLDARRDKHFGFMDIVNVFSVDHRLITLT